MILARMDSSETVCMEMNGSTLNPMLGKENHRFLSCSKHSSNLHAAHSAGCTSPLLGIPTRRMFDTVLEFLVQAELCENLVLIQLDLVPNPLESDLFAF